MMFAAGALWGANAQNVNVFPHAESFENGLGDWSVVDADGDGSTWMVVDFSQVPSAYAFLGYFAQEGMRVLWSESANDSATLTPCNWAVSPVVEVPSDDSLRMSWWVKRMDGAGERYEVRVGVAMDGPVDTADFPDLLLADTATSTGYVQRTVDLTPYAGQWVRVAFVHRGGTGGSMQVDYVLFGNGDNPLQPPVEEDCDVLDRVPFVEDFADSSTTLACWRTMGNGGTPWEMADGLAASSSVTFFGMVPEADHWLVSPRMALEFSYYYVSWKVQAEQSEWRDESWEHYSVYVFRGAGEVDTTQMVPLFSETLLSTDGWQQRFASLEDFGGDTIRLAFRHHATDDQERLLLDEVKVDFAGAPVVSLHAPARAIVADSVHFRLDTFSVEPITDITWRVQMDTLGSELTFSTMDPFAFVWPVGTEEGDYWVWVEATNDEGTATDSAQVHLHVCEVDSVPYVHVFGLDEDCWRVGEGWLTGMDTVEVNGVALPTAISFSHDEWGRDLAADNRIATPYIYIPDSTYELRYRAMDTRNFNVDNGIDLYNVIARTADGVDTLFSGVVSGSAPQGYRFGLAAYAGKDLQVEFRHHDSPMGYALRLADVQIVPVGEPEIEIVAPSRARNIDFVSLGARVVSSENLTYSWTLAGANPATATGSQVEVQWPAAGTYTIGLTVTSPLYGDFHDSATITIVECSGGETLPFVEPFDLDMGCWASYDLDGDGQEWEMALRGDPTDMMFDALLAYGGSGNSVVSWSARPVGNLFSYILSGATQPLSADNLLLSPAITLPDTGSWRFSMQAASAVTLLGTLAESPDEQLDEFEMLVTTREPDDRINLSDFQVLMPLRTAEGEGFAPYGVSLDNYRGQTVRVAVRHRAYNRLGLLVDDVSVAIDTTTPEPVEPIDTTAISEVENMNIRVYPNPVSDRLTVEVDGLRRVEMLDLTGRLVMKLEGEVTILPTEALERGVYLLRITTDKGTAARKIIKR